MVTGKFVFNKKWFKNYPWAEVKLLYHWLQMLYMQQIVLEK
jgi:hypothetical protein